MVVLLLNLGAQFCPPKKLVRESPLRLAVSFNKKDIVSLLLGAWEDSSDNMARIDHAAAIVMAVCLGYEEVTQLLVDKLADLYKGEKHYHETIAEGINYAIQEGQVGVAKIFLAKDPSVLAKLANWMSFVQVAAQNGDEAIFRLLLDHGASDEAIFLRCIGT
ncbi:hypothetical protein B0T17DRAFT_642215 [Bombardia bombarda]|uniref:Ankyrin repeat protein n=1 Tax=Bombardia bombarda TaxID=252184 RepID=A0AA39WUP4_9PEZI|nr:hypothetical protein B0T17DRAFT_642215 [Bombardia bombarda]